MQGRRQVPWERLLMTEFQKADQDGNGAVDEHEFNSYQAKLDLERMKLEIEDADAQRDQQRKMAWFSLVGMLLYPFSVVLASWLNLSQAADILGAMASIYFVSVAGIVGVFFGVTNMGKGGTKSDK
jgi:hypothetical protein